MNQLPALARVFAYLSLLTVGGGMAAFPEMKILTVDVHQWLTSAQLVHLYSVGQLAPGPNMMMIVPIGDWTGGPLGALLVLVAFFGPTALLTFVVGRWWARLETWPWRGSIQRRAVGKTGAMHGTPNQSDALARISCSKTRQGSCRGAPPSRHEHRAPA